MRRHNFFDIIMTLLAVTIALSALYLFLNDFTLTKLNKSQNEKKQIAEISLMKNSVKRRFANLPVWEGVQIDEKIYDNDQIFTGDNSKAHLKFKDGSIIEMRQNSLVVVSTRNENTEISVKRGSLVATLTRENSSLKLKIGDTETQLSSKNTVLQIKAKKGGGC